MVFKKYNNDAELSHVYYYNRNVEVDFFVPEEGLAIQVSYSIEPVDTRNREISALKALNKIYPLKKALIITYDEEDSVETEGLSIEVVPIWKWLTLRKYAN